MLETLGRLTCCVTLVSQLPLLGHLTHPEPRHAYQERVGSTKDSPNHFLSEGWGGGVDVNGSYLTGTDVNNMLNTFESGGRLK